MSIYDTLDANAISILKDIQAKFAAPHIVRAHTLDFMSRKDGVERRVEADGIKDLLRYLPALIRKAEANLDPDYVAPPVDPATAAAGARPNAPPISST